MSDISIYLAIFIIFCIFSFIIFVIFLRNKLNILEKELKLKFKKRNYKIISIFYISERFINKHSEVFAEIISLLKKDFNEDKSNINFENKIDTYKKIKKEMDFIFKICNWNWVLVQVPQYNYIKTEMENLWIDISKNYNLYEEKANYYKKFHKISKFFIIWYFI